MSIITKEELNKKIEDSKTNNKILIIDFAAEWCGPCRALSPILDKLAEENQDIQVIKVNVDENADLSMEYGIRSIPAVYIYKEGKETAKFLGLKGKADILKLI